MSTKVTCSHEPDYIRAVSQRYRRIRSGSSVSQRSAVTVSVLDLQRGHLTEDATLSPRSTLSVSPRAESVSSYQSKVTVMNQLLFFYSAKILDQDLFPSRSRRLLQSRGSLTGQAWQCSNEAFLQLYKTSTRYPRHGRLLQAKLILHRDPCPPCST